MLKQTIDRRRRIRAAALVAAASLFGSLSVARAVTYTAADTFDLNPSGITDSIANSVSGTGLVG